MNNNILLYLSFYAVAIIAIVVAGWLKLVNPDYVAITITGVLTYAAGVITPSPVVKANVDATQKGALP